MSLINNNQKGFTLVETLVAITVLMIGVIGPLNTAVKGITDGLFAANQIAANYLAQEAIETVLWKRNVDIQGPNGDGTDWAINLNNLAQNCKDPLGNSASVCVIDPWDGTGDVITSATCPGTTPNRSSPTPCDLIFSDTQAKYVNPSGAGATIGTVFSRRVYLIPTILATGEVGEIKVVAKIDWSNRGDPRSMTLIGRLYPMF